MIKETTLKIFLTSGVTLTVKANEKVYVGENQHNLYGLETIIKEVIDAKGTLEFSAEIPHPYKDEKGKDKTQNIKHYYHIPYDRISWFMIEEV